MHKDTIFALASAPGQAGVAVVRVSGPAAWESTKVLVNKDNLVPRMSILAAITHPVSRETLDQALILPFKGPASYTGEDVVEYHLHGGRAVVESVLAVLGEQPGHRLAGPGEFTRRAFEHGKMDLTEAEAVADLIAAETQAQKAQALSQMSGVLADLYEGWMEALKKMLAHLEAAIEFPDEDLPEDEITSQIVPKVTGLLDQICTHLNDNRRGERLREGVQIAIIGAPNAGKSSLLNALAQRDVAIVSDMAGTTRDVLEVHLDLGGYPVILADTAGLRPDQLSEAHAQDKIESEGIRRALDRARAADLKLLLFDGTQEQADTHTLELRDKNALCVVNKADQGIVLEGLDPDCVISAKDGQGLEDLLKLLVNNVKDMFGVQEAPALTRARHREALEEAVEALNRALNAVLPELMAEDVRLAVRALGKITGRVDVDQLLDVIFRDFCIGK